MTDLQPKLLASAAAATVGFMMTSDSKILWVPKSDRNPNATGKWVPASEACFLPKKMKASEEALSCIVSVGRRAGLQIPEMPDHVSKVILVYTSRPVPFMQPWLSNLALPATNASSWHC